MGLGCNQGPWGCVHKAVGLLLVSQEEFHTNAAQNCPVTINTMIRSNQIQQKAARTYDVAINFRGTAAFPAQLSRMPPSRLPELLPATLTAAQRTLYVAWWVIRAGGLTLCLIPCLLFRCFLACLFVCSRLVAFCSEMLRFFACCTLPLSSLRHFPS